MKFTKLRLVGLQTIDLPIKGVVSSIPAYLVKAIDGLGPTEVDVSIAQTLFQGGVYQGRRPQPREIVIRMGLNANFAADKTVEDMRQQLYGLLTPGYSDQILVEVLDGATVMTSNVGWVKKMEIVPFSKEPEVQITIATLDAYLQAPALALTALGGLSKSNPQISNAGDAPSGFHMELTFNISQPSGWTLSDEFGLKKMQFARSFSSGDKLIFDTEPGQRQITVIRSGTPINFIGSLTADSTWFTLHGGANNFVTSNINFTWNLVSHWPQFWGV